MLKTTPNITPVPPRKTDYKPPARPVVSSHQIGGNSNNKSYNMRNTGPNRFNNTTKSNDSSSVRSASTVVKKR